MKPPRQRCVSSAADLPFFFESVHLELADQARHLALGVLSRNDDAAHAGAPIEARCRHLARTLADARLLEAVVPAPYSKLAHARADGIDVRTVCVVREMLAWGSPLAEFVFAMQGLGSYPIVIAGTHAQRETYLPLVASGRALAAFAITEPEAGSDVAAIRTRADRDGDRYVIHGAKVFISNAGFADHYVVFAKTQPEAGSRGITAFIVRPDDPGFVAPEPTELLAEHPVGTLRFEGLEVPADRRLGAEGDGFRIAMATLDTFRSTVGAAALGLAHRALDEALARVVDRRQFGQPIGDFQSTRTTLADMATELDAARLLVYRAAYLKDHGAERVTKEASMAKYYATEVAQRIVDGALQLHGASGLVRGHVLERLYREVRALRIYEGTSEIQRLIIGGALVDGERARANEAHALAAELAGSAGSGAQLREK